VIPLIPSGSLSAAGLVGDRSLALTEPAIASPSAEAQGATRTKRSLVQPLRAAMKPDLGHSVGLIRANVALTR
jgi:hypothetical protein